MEHVLKELNKREEKGAADRRIEEGEDNNDKSSSSSTIDTSDISLL